MLQDKAQCGYFGSIGNDPFGEQIQKELGREQVVGYFHVSESTPTGTCAVLITEKERSLVANLAASLLFPLEHLTSNLDKLHNTKVLYLSSFFLSSNSTAAIEMAKFATANERIFCINLAAHFLIEMNKDEMMEGISYAEYVFGNESEAEKFGQVHKYETSDITEIGKKMAQLPCLGNFRRKVVFTQGFNPTLVCDGETILQFPVDILPSESIVDLNGAGDSFVGGFLSMLIQDESLEKCVYAGHYAAGEIIRRSACSLPEYPPQFT